MTRNPLTEKNPQVAGYCWAGPMPWRNTERSPAREISMKWHREDILHSAHHSYFQEKQTAAQTKPQTTQTSEMYIKTSRREETSEIWESRERSSPAEGTTGLEEVQPAICSLHWNKWDETVPGSKWFGWLEHNNMLVPQNGRSHVDFITRE